MTLTDDEISESLIRAEFAGFAEQEHNRRRPSILIADPSNPIRDQIATLLKSDFEIAGEAENGWHALEQCLDTRPDAVILNVQLPVMNGSQVARALKQLLPETYIIFVTERRWSECLTEAFLAGGDGYVHKTRLTQELSSVLRRGLKKRSETPIHARNR
jgi:DNA-binding NarL/FixJ family response regulator